MNEKEIHIAALREQLQSWELLLARLTPVQMETRPAPADYSVRDTLAHLYAWQQVSRARLRAALDGRDPRYPAWLGGHGPEEEEQLDAFNARIVAEQRALSGVDVRTAWREGFLDLLELAEALPEADLLSPGRYAWLAQYPLAAVLDGSRGHHAEHLAFFTALFPPNGGR